MLHWDWQVALTLGVHALRAQRQRHKELKSQCNASVTNIWEAQAGRDLTQEGIPGGLHRGGLRQ